MTIVLHDLQHTVVGDANEYCVVNIGWIRVHCEPFYSIDYTIEDGYQVAKIGACVFLDLA